MEDQDNSIGEYQKEIVTQEEVNIFLDSLRKSCEINMFGARPYIAGSFGITKNQAGKMLSEWMRTFSERHPS